MTNPGPPPLTQAERDAAAEAHVDRDGIRCDVCGLDFLPAAYDAHIEDEHARGLRKAPRTTSRRRDVWDVTRGLWYLFTDRIRR